MGFWSRLFGQQEPPSAAQTTGSVGLVGQPVAVVVGPTEAAHARNRARIERLKAALATETRPRQRNELQSELVERQRFLPREG